MGARQFSDLDNRRVNEIATEVNAQFAKDFSIAFKNAVIKQLKGAYLEGNDHYNHYVLMQHDSPSHAIKLGFLTKIGANVKSWKRRFFVAHNKSDNFIVIYYEDETMRKEKGRVCCCGYRVEAFTADEVNWYGVYGIKLTSHNGEKRQWLFRADTDRDQSEWLEVFMNACKKSRPEPIKDAVYNIAFAQAFCRTRVAYGYFGVFHPAGDEFESLEQLTHQILSRELLDDYILMRSKQQPANAKMIVTDVYQHVQRTVRPIVKHNWETCYSAVKVLKAPFELSVKASLSSLLYTETEIKAFLEGKIHELVEPYLNDIEQSISTPLLQACFRSMARAYEFALKGLYASIHTAIQDTPHSAISNNNNNNNDSRSNNSSAVAETPTNNHSNMPRDPSHKNDDDEDNNNNDNNNNKTTTTRNSQGATSGSSRRCYYTVDDVRIALYHLNMQIEQGSHGQQGPLVQSQKLLWSMHTEDLSEPHLHEIWIESGIQGFDVYSRTMDELKALSHNALYTFGTLALSHRPNSNSSSSTGNSASSNSTTNSRHSHRHSSRSEHGATSSSVDGFSTPRKSNGKADTASDAPNDSVDNGRSRSHSKSQHQRTPLNSVDGTIMDIHHRQHRSRSGGSIVSRGQLLRALADTIERVAIDATTSLQRGVVKLLQDAMISRVQEYMLVPSAYEVSSAQPLVTRETSMMIHLPSVGEAMVHAVVEDFIQQLIGARLHQAAETFQRAAQALAQAARAQQSSSSASRSNSTTTATTPITTTSARKNNGTQMASGDSGSSSSSKDVAVGSVIQADSTTTGNSRVVASIPTGENDETIITTTTVGTNSPGVSLGTTVSATAITASPKPPPAIPTAAAAGAGGGGAATGAWNPGVSAVVGATSAVAKAAIDGHHEAKYECRPQQDEE